jgi:hypothetical protein
MSVMSVVLEAKKGTAAYGPLSMDKFRWIER